MVYITHHVIKLTSHTNLNIINVLIEKWMLCDELWVLGKEKGEFCMRTKGNIKYSF
jgi:hypothetical protein